MTHDLRAKLAAATRLAEGATTPGERDAAKAAIKRLKKAMKREGQDRPFEAPPVAAGCVHHWMGTIDPRGQALLYCRNCGALKPNPAVQFTYTGTPEGFQQAWDEFLHGKRREAPKRAGSVKFPKAASAAYPRAYPRK